MKSLLGILSEWQGEERADRPFGAQAPLFEAVLRAAEDSPLQACVIPQQELEEPIPNSVLRAYVFTEGQWKEVSSPFPDVIYNRMPNRSTEQTKKYKAFYRALLDHAKGRVFNRTGFFSKHHIYTILIKKHPANVRIPFTKKVTTAQQVLQSVKRRGKVWLKPDDGSLGRGVCRLIQEPYGYTLEVGDHGSAEHLDENQARSRITSLLRGNGPYIVQQNIDLGKYESRTFDIRVLLHKDKHNQFKVTHQFARVTEHGNIVSNIRTGGDAVALGKVLTAKEITRLKTAALAIANRLAAALGGPIGEVGLDLALDQKRRLWLVEANSKPFLNMDPADALTQKIAAHLVDYAHYLLEEPQQPKRATPARKTKVMAEAASTLRRNSKPAPRGSTTR